MATLSIQLSANIQELTRELKRAREDLAKLGDVADKNAAKVERATKKTGAGMKKLGGETANALPALTDFSRVIQDAPFGIIGVGNNITQLASSFGNLQKSTGGPISAFRALGASLAGPGGMVFAISTVVTLLTVFGDKLFGSKTKAETAAEAQKKYNDALQDYVGSLEAIRKADTKGRQGAAQELTSLSLLRNAIQDTTLTMDKRKLAVDELQKKFPAYFKNLDDEKILNGDVADAYDRTTESILARAKATAAVNLLVDNAANELALGEKVLDQNNKIAEAEKKLAIQRAKGATFINAQTGQISVNPEIARLEKEVRDLTEVRKGYEAEVTKIQAESERLTKFAQTQTPESLVPDPPDIKWPQDKVRKLFADIDKEMAKMASEELGIQQREAIETAFEDIFGAPLKYWDAEDSRKLFNKIGEEMSAIAQEEVWDELAETSAFISTLPALPVPEVPNEEEMVALDKYLDRLQKFNDDANAIINGAIAATFAGLGSAIGDALMGTNSIINGLGQTVLSGLGSILTSLGELAIQAGVGMLAVKLALDSLNPWAAIAAGVAMIAIGQVFAKGSQQLSGKIGGGGGRGGSFSGGSTSFSGSSFSASSDGGFGGTVVFEIQGKKLVGVLNRTLKDSGRTVADII